MLISKIDRYDPRNVSMKDKGEKDRGQETLSWESQPGNRPRPVSLGKHINNVCVREREAEGERRDGRGERKRRIETKKEVCTGKWVGHIDYQKWRIQGSLIMCVCVSECVSVCMYVSLRRTWCRSG